MRLLSGDGLNKYWQCRWLSIQIAFPYDDDEKWQSFWDNCFSWGINLRIFHAVYMHDSCESSLDLCLFKFLVIISWW